MTGFGCWVQNSYPVCSSMHQPPPWTTSAGTDRKTTTCVLTSCLQARWWTGCMPVLCDAFAILPYATALRRNITLAKGRKMQSFHNAVFYSTSLSPHCFQNIPYWLVLANSKKKMKPSRWIKQQPHIEQVTTVKQISTFPFKNISFL